MSDARLRAIERGAELGSEWSHPRFRGQWKVTRVGKKYVYLASPNPALYEVRVELIMWPGAWQPKHEVR